MIWLLCVQLISIKLVDMSEIYYELSSSTSSDKTSHKSSISFLHSICINNMLITINYILLLPKSNEEWPLNDNVNHVITSTLWTPDMNMLL